MNKPRLLCFIFYIVFVVFDLAGCVSDGVLSETVFEPTKEQPPTDTARMLPDLEVVDISLELNKEKICQTDQNRFIIQVSIRNSGKSLSKPFTVRVNQYEQSVSAFLKPGEMIDFDFPGDRSAAVNVDTLNEIEESDERNNFLVEDFEIPEYPLQCLQTPTPELSSLSPAHTLIGHTAAVLSLDFSPDGELLTSGSVDNTMRIWNVDKASLLRTMYGHPFPILVLKYSPNGSFLVTGSTDGTGRIWRVADGELVGQLEGHAGWVNDLNISSDGGLITTCGDDYTVRVWRFLDTKLIQTIDEGMSKISQIDFLPGDERLVWSEENGTIRIRSLDGQWLHIMDDSNISASAIALDPEGEILISGHSNGQLNIWDVNHGERLRSISGHSKPIKSLAFSPDGKWLVSSALDKHPRIWKVSTRGNELFPTFILNGHEGPVNSVAFSPDSRMVATGSDDHTIRLWEIPQE